MAIGNGKCNFKRKITENHFSAGKNNKIHKIYKISQTKWIYFHATLPRIRVYIYNTHLYVNGISNILYVQSLWENGISIFPPYWNGIEDFQKRKRQFFETENQCPYPRELELIHLYAVHVTFEMKMVNYSTWYLASTKFCETNCTYLDINFFSGFLVNTQYGYWL